LPSLSNRFSQLIEALNNDASFSALRGIKHGVEREALRITPEGHLSQSKHPEGLGAALTHDTITTDFSEALLEFITPPEVSPKTTIAQLSDIHKFALSEMGDEALWPMSMPCYVTGESQIRIADYGTSNVGRMKKTYRVGLKNRYGSMMQAIAGIHFNFSLPEEFWSLWADVNQQSYSQAFQSQQYFDLIRNYRRWCWLIPYLYGASPAVCGSFLKGKAHKLPFQTIGKGTLYLPFATSLRMSDLGYTNSQQSALHICYNRLPDYVKSVRKAINTDSSEYAQYAAGENGIYEQLNRNILQIENELYSPIRPKQVARSMEKPTDALEDRGVSYIEVRALDVNPYSAVGIEERQFYFLDVFLLTCLIIESPDFDEQSYSETETNLSRVVLEGRNPDLTLIHRDASDNVQEQRLVDWAESLFEHFAAVAVLLDKANQTEAYSQAVAAERLKVHNPNLTPSGKWLKQLLEEQRDNVELGLSLSKRYRQELLSLEYEELDVDYFRRAATDSVAQQQQIEASDEKPFDQFLNDYFAQ
jgi:glutamate--cysteine ligase